METKVHQSGFILYTIRFDECVAFYQKILGLKVLYKKESLICFDFYGSYLMVEADDESGATTSHVPGRDRACIRLNVQNVKDACKALDEHSIPYQYGEYEWGSVAKFRDPDGNLIGFRSALEHQKDITAE